MRKHKGLILAGVLILALIGLPYVQRMEIGSAQACDWNPSGGKDYVPQRQGPSGSLAKRPVLSPEQAFDVVANYVKKLNPQLKIGPLQDAGSYYEAEVLAANGDVVQRLGIDKESGRMILIN